MADAVKKNTERVAAAVKEVEKSADRSTVLAADRTIFAAERTYAAWVRTGLAALAAGVGAKAVLGQVMAESSSSPQAPCWSCSAPSASLPACGVSCFPARRRLRRMCAACRRPCSWG